MAINKHNFQNESPIQKKIRLLLYPVIFSLLSILNAQGQEAKDTKNIPDSKNIKQTEIVTDSLFLISFEKVFNQLTKPDLSDLGRSRLEKNIIQ